MEAIVLLTPVVKYLIGILDDHARLDVAVKDKVKSLQVELSFISAYLDPPEGKRRKSAMSELAIRQIREKAYSAEDEIDTYIRIKTEKHSKWNAVLERLRGWGRRKDISEVADTIENLRKEIHEIFELEKQYPIQNSPTGVEAESEGKQELHKQVSEFEEDDVVGFDDKSVELKKLVEEKGTKLDVISIIGMGGLGKTTLAKKMYEGAVSGSSFARCVWVYVSHEYAKTKDLLLAILKEMGISKEFGKCMEKDELKKTLLANLDGKRYFIVMDDVWKTDFWNEVRSAFPDNSNGSRILITSRIKAVALEASTTPPYILRILNKDESYELFCKKVFQGGECPHGLEPLARQLAEGCRGLPLSIVKLADFLKHKQQKLLIWSNIKVNSHLTQCKHILALSYTHLPRPLKPCFLYLCVYPEDSEIPVRQLINLWIAESFIEHTPNKSLEDVAEEYLENLIDRSLIQVASKRVDKTSVKTCCIHDLLRNLCISQSDEEEFLEVHTDTDVNRSSKNKSRRLSIQGSIDSYISSNSSHSTFKPRSLLFLGQDTNEFDQKQWTWVQENFLLVRVFNFGHVNLSDHTRIGRFINLKYLRIKPDAMGDIPASIRYLTNLETLDMRGSIIIDRLPNGMWKRRRSDFLKRLPKGIWKLRRLRNLHMSGPVILPNLNPAERVLWSLQVLSTVSLTPKYVGLIVKAPNIRKLGIWFEDESKSKVADVLSSLMDLSHLKTLKIINCSEQPGLPIKFPSNITKITLRQVSIEVDGSMKVLGELTSLSILKLESCRLSRNFEFTAGSFPRLEVLKLENLGIKEWKQEKDTIPFLKHLVIKECHVLTVFPSEPWSPGRCALLDVEVAWSSRELVIQLQKLEKDLGFKLHIDPPNLTRATTK